MNEIWKRVPLNGFASRYLISDTGRVFSMHRHRELKPKMSNTGYLRVTLCNDGEHRTVCIHRLVAMAFIPNPDGKPTVNHLNEIKTDNRAENLEWATTAEQNAYGTRTERAMAHTDWVKRNEKTDYKSVASKHDYQRDEMCNRHVTEAFMGDKSVGVYRSQREAAAATGAKPSDVSQCVNGTRKTANGYRFRRIAVTKRHFPEEEA